MKRIVRASFAVLIAAIAFTGSARSADRPVNWIGSRPSDAPAATAETREEHLRSWPIAIGQNFGSPMFYDLNGDGIMEVITADRQRTYVFNAQGNALPGWPRTTGEVDNSPAVADIDEDGSPEIIVAIVGAPPKIGVYNIDGTSQIGFPVSLPYQNWLNVSAPAVGDVDGDGHLDVGAQSEPGVAFFNRFGLPLPGWPYTWTTSQNIVWSAPAIADLDRDGATEVVVGNNNLYGCSVHVIRSDGTAMPGWPCYTNNIFSSAAVGDLDGDGDLEIVIQEGDDTWYGNRMFVWHHDGTILPGWPKEIAPQWESSRSNPAIADVDGDGNLEIVTATADGMLHMIHVNGEEFPGFPRHLPVTSPISSVQVVDIDADGTEEFFLCYYSGGNQWVGGWRLDGSSLAGFPKLLFTGSEINAHGSTHVADMDGDGDLDLCAQGTDFDAGLVWVYGVDGSVYDPATSRTDWPKIRRDPRNTGYYPRRNPALVSDGPSVLPQDLALYPNPVRQGEVIRLRAPGGRPATLIRVFDVAGREVGGKRYQSGDGFTGRVEGLFERDPAPGLYFLRPARGGVDGKVTRLVLLPR